MNLLSAIHEYKANGFDDLMIRDDRIVSAVYRLRSSKPRELVVERSCRIPWPRFKRQVRQ